MSADSYTAVYHLTKAGWEAGVSGCYLSEESKKAALPPVGRLLTLRYHESTPAIKTHYSCHVDYVTPTRYEDLLRAVSIYGAYPPDMASEADAYQQDTYLMRLFPGSAYKQKIRTV